MTLEEVFRSLERMVAYDSHRVWVPALLVCPVGTDLFRTVRSFADIARRFIGIPNLIVLLFLCCVVVPETRRGPWQSNLDGGGTGGRVGRGVPCAFTLQMLS